MGAHPAQCASPSADRIGSVYTAQATLSRESDRDADPALDSRGTLVRIGWEANHASGIATHAAALVQRSRYGEVDPALGVRGNDRYAELNIGIAGDVAAGVQRRLDAVVSRYRSSIATVDGDSRSVVAGITWKF